MWKTPDSLDLPRYERRLGMNCGQDCADNMRRGIRKWYRVIFGGGSVALCFMWGGCGGV